MFQIREVLAPAGCRLVSPKVGQSDDRDLKTIARPGDTVLPRLFELEPGNSANDLDTMGRHAEAHDNRFFSEKIFLDIREVEFPERLNGPCLISASPTIQKSISLVFHGQPWKPTAYPPIRR